VWISKREILLHACYISAGISMMAIYTIPSFH